MKNKKIVIAGGSGFIGQEMIKYWSKDNHLIILTRQLNTTNNNRNHYSSLSNEDLKKVDFNIWDGKTTGEWIKNLEEADILINLTGKTVNCRYTQKNKKEILNSRIDSVQALGAAINLCNNPPPLWINASSATIYPHALHFPQDEFVTEFHNGFSVTVCQQWEKKFFEQETHATRKVALRMAITLGPGGVLIPYFNLLKIGLGGKQGNGRQMYSWIHIEDTCRMIEWIMNKKELNGIYNCCSPNPVTNNEFMKTFRKVTGYKFGLPAFEWMLRIGAVIIGTESELVLKSRWVIPTKIINTGFQFKYPFLKEAFEEILIKVPRKQYHLF